MPTFLKPTIPPMDAATVAHHCAELELHTKSLDARKAMARLAIKFGNLTDCGRAEYARYLASL